MMIENMQILLNLAKMKSKVKYFFYLANQWTTQPMFI